MGRKELFSVVLLTLMIVSGVVLYNTSINHSKQLIVDKKAPQEHPAFTQRELAERLAGSLRIPTVSYEDRSTNISVFLQLHEYMESKFPRVYRELFVHKLGEENLSLLFEWPGVNHGTPNDKPALFASHLDVVGVPEDTLDKWTVDPFAGIIDEEFIWGRGSIDDKQGVFAILEATEWLLSLGHKPKNSIYLGFGHDEEISGFKGAHFIAEWFKERSITIEYLVDEGMTLYRDFPIPIQELALIGLAEKGSVTVEISAHSKGGHASLSTKETTVDIVSKAVAKISDNPMPVQFSAASPFHKALEYMGPEFGNFALKAIFSNFWLFDPIIARLATMDSLASVNVRTTAAATMISGGIKSNVLPTKTTAIINHRIVPGDTVASVVQHDIDVINDPRVNVTIVKNEGLEPSPISSEVSPAFKLLSQSIREVFPGTPVIPSLFVANTDTRHYWDIAKDIYRFCPTKMTPSDLSRFHGIDERISISNYFEFILFYFQLIQNHSDLGTS
uniref:Peptidase M20 dimerisation domain-containing protein n=1 Tax=Vannella robusta TaxID=1487602 RepID=A0A7S4ML98_9EUKA